MFEPARLLHELAAEIRGCPKCRLSETRTCAVPGEGSHTARIMFVGEGPGEKEDLSGRPFVGAAGQFLNTLLEEAGIERRDVFITNIVKCRPPQNREPFPDEVEACNDYLMAQIAIIQPKIICPLGAPALRTLVSPNLKITQARCKVYRKSGILMIPLFHPAAALHRKELQSTLQADIRKLRELINREIREDEIIDLTPPRRVAETVSCGGTDSAQNEPGVASRKPKTATEEPVAETNLSLF